MALSHGQAFFPAQKPARKKMLSAGQEAFIEGAIGHLLEFPTDVTELTSAVDHLKSALSTPLDPGVDPGDEFYFLYNCLLKPQGSLKRLETYNDKNARVTVGDVQHHIIDLITTAINAAAFKSDKTASDVGWHPDNIKMQIISGKNEQTIFATDAAPAVMYVHPWQRIQCEDSIYMGTLAIADGSEFVRLDIQIDLNDDIRKVTVLDFKPIPLEDYYENDLLTSHLDDALASACEHAKEFVYSHLVRNGLTSDEIADIAGTNLYLKWLITDKFYFTSLVTRKLVLDELTPLDGDQIDKLLTPIAKGLISSDLCPLSAVIRLTETELRVFSSYFSLLQHQRLKPADVFGVNTEQARVLTHPVITHLVRQDKLLFSTAKRLPSYLCILLSSPLYQEYILREPIDWTRMRHLTKTHCDFLLNKQIANLIKHQAFEITDILFVNEEVYRQLLDPQTQLLLQDKKMSLKDVALCTKKAIAIIHQHPEVRLWLFRNVISVQDINNGHLPFIYTKIIVKRLIAIFDNTPVTINGSCDTLEKVTADIPVMAQFAGITPEIMREHIIKRFVWSIHIKFHDLLSKGLAVQEMPAAQRLLVTLSGMKDFKPWNTIFAELLCEAKTISEQKYQPLNLPTLFPREKQPGKLAAFCKKLLEYSQLIPEKLTLSCTQTSSP